MFHKRLGISQLNYDCQRLQKNSSSFKIVKLFILRASIIIATDVTSFELNSHVGGGGLFNSKLHGFEISCIMNAVRDENRRTSLHRVALTVVQTDGRTDGNFKIKRLRVQASVGNASRDAKDSGCVKQLSFTREFLREQSEFLGYTVHTQRPHKIQSPPLVRPHQSA